MILKSMKLRNVKCYDDAEVAFTQGKNVIIGSNGSGKSTLLQSILYSMYALYPQGPNDQLVRTGSSVAEFELEFEHAGHEYLVERKLRSGGAPEAYLTDKSEDMLRAETQTGVTDELSELTQVKKEVFRDVILVRQGEIARIIDMRPAERKDLFDRLLGLHDYEQAYQSCARIKKALSYRIQEAEKIIEAYKDSAGKLGERKATLSERRKALTSNKVKLRTKTQEFAEINQKWQYLENLSKRISNLESSTRTRSKLLERNKKSAEKHQEKINDLSSSLGYSAPKGLVGKLLKSLADRAEEEHASVFATIDMANKVRTKMERLSERVVSAQKQLATSEQELAGNNSKAVNEEGNDWRVKANKDLDELKTKMKKISDEIKAAETESRKQVAASANEESNVSRLEKELTNLTKLVGKKCPKCKQLVTDEHAKELSRSSREELKKSKKLAEDLRKQSDAAEQLVDELQGQKKEIDELIGLVKRLAIYLDRERTIRGMMGKQAKELEALQTQIEDVSLQLDNLQGLGLKKSDFEDLPLESKITGLEVILEPMQVRMSSLVSLSTEAGNLASVADQIKDEEILLGKETQQLEQQKEKYDSKQHKQLKEKREELRGKVSSISERVRILRNEQIPAAEEQYEESKRAADSIASIGAEQEIATKALAVLEKLREFYREVQRPLRRRDLSRASTEASEIFRTLIGSNEFERIRITEDHELEVSRLGELESMTMLSGGEQVIASLSVRLGFARALASSDLLMLDEPTAFLDDQRRAELVETLYRVSPAKQMLIVTHDDEFERVAQRVIHVEKDETSLISSVSWEE